MPEGAAEPGAVVRVDGNRLAVGTGEGLLEIRHLQLEGRRPAAAEDFVRGYPDFLGAQLG